MYFVLAHYTRLVHTEIYSHCKPHTLTHTGHLRDQSDPVDLLAVLRVPSGTHNTRVCVYVHTLSHAYTHVHTHASLFSLSVILHSHTHTHTHTLTHTHTHTHTARPVWSMLGALLQRLPTPRDVHMRILAVSASDTTRVVDFSILQNCLQVRDSVVCACVHVMGWCV